MRASAAILPRLPHLWATGDSLKETVPRTLSVSYSYPPSTGVPPDYPWRRGLSAEAPLKEES